MTLRRGMFVLLVLLVGNGCAQEGALDDSPMDASISEQSLPLGYDGPGWASNAGADAPPATMTMPPASQCDRWAAYNGTGTSCTSSSPCALSTCVGQLGTTYQVCCLLAPPSGSSYSVSSTLRPSASGTPSRPLVLRKAPEAPSPASKPTTNTPCTLNSGRVTLTLNTTAALMTFRGSDDSARNWWAVEGIDFNLNGVQSSGGIVHPHDSTGLLLRDSVVRDGAFKNAVVINGDDVQVLDNCIFNHFRPNAEDAHAIAVVGVQGLGIPQRVRIANNWLYDAGGDGVQCNDGSNVDFGLCTPSSSCPRNPVGLPRDIWIQDNRMFTTPARYGQTENAVDIKSCSDLTIGGTVSPRSNLHDRNVAQNKYSGFRGSPVVFHYDAKRILFENTRIWDTGGGIALGRGTDPWSWYATEEIVIKNNLINDLCTDTGCSGQGIRLAKARRVDIFNNTFDDIPATVFRLGIDNTTSERSEDIDLWNNIVRSSGNRWIETSLGKVRGLESGYNVFWAPGATNTTVKFRADGCAGGSNSGGFTWWQGCVDGNAILAADNLGVAPYASSVADPLLDIYYYTAPTSPARDSGVTGIGYTYSTWGGTGPDKGFRETY